MLDNRKKKILQAIVEEYIETAEPVSSKAITKEHDLNLSSATIRNEMAELEKSGLLDKMHTSSGRVPSAEGYRYYVDELLNTNSISKEEIKYIKEKLEKKVNTIEDLTKITTSTLSEITHYTSVGISPNVENQEIKEIKFILLGDNVLMAIIFTKQGLIKETIIKFEENINQNQIETLNEMFNSKLKDKPLSEINKPFEEYMFEKMDDLLNVAKPILERLKKMLESDSKVYMEGTNKNFELPELQSPDTAKEFIDILDQTNNKMLKVLNEKSNDNEINVYIGGEDDDSLKDFSIVTLTENGDEKNIGTIAIIGPKRMDYSKVISAMKIVSKEIKKSSRKEDKNGRK